uniref:Protein ZGRF1 n=1 Tax=Petromyzon marinus TaxID=7757 RepID=A0AAJ7TF48_PETMA|nr:protein ZGRF1 [Petromyzon marinus]XP_032816710.1 protein ZGRF1 [Petromyzon marinus]XP_032816721.1 protein ZGRF1 [Petromyzon marinus]
MASQEFTVLYTHQKTKKAKAWQDGILRTHGNGGKAILFDDKGLRLDSVFLKGQKVTVGLELESDRFLITVEESTNPTNSLVSATPKPTNPEPPRRPCLPSFKRKHTTGSFRTPREVEVEVKAEESSPPALGSSLPGNGDSKASSLQQGHSAVCHPDYTEATESGPGNTVLPALWGSLPGRKSTTGKMPPRATLPSNEEYRGIPNNISGRRDGVIVRAVQPADLGGAEDGIGVLYEDRRDREADPDRKTSECIFVVDSNGRSTDAKRTKAQILALLMQGDGGGGAGAGQFNNSPSSQEKHAFWDQQFDQNGSKIGHTDRSSSQDKEQPILSNKQHCLGKLHCENQRQAYIENVQPHRGEEPSLIGQQPSQDKLWPYMGMDSCKQHSQAMPQPYQQQQHSDQYKHSDWSNAESSQGSVQLNPAAEPCLEKLNLYQDKQTYQNKVQPLKSKVQSHESLQPNPDTQSEYYELQSCLDDELHTIAQSSSERQPPFLDKIQPYTDMQPTVDKQLHCAELKLQNKQNPPEDQHPTSKIQPKIDTQPYQGKSQPNIDPQLQQDTLQPFPVSVALQNTLETHQQTQQEPTHLDPQSSQDSNLVHRTVPADVRVFRTEPTIQDSQPMVDFNVFSAWASELWAGDSQPGTFSEDASVQPAQPLPEQLHPAQLPATHSPVSVAGCVASDESSAAANGVGTHAVLPDSSGSLSMTVEPCNIEDEMRSAHYVPSKGHSVCGIGGSDGGEDDGIGSKGVDYACNVKASNSDSIIYEDCFIDSAPVSPVEVSQRRGKPIALLRAMETYASQSQASVDTMDISLSLEEQDEQVEEATEVSCLQRFQQQHVVSSQDVFRDPEGLTPMHVLEPHQHFTHPECLSPKKKADPAQCFMAQRQQQDILASGSSDFEMSRCFEMSRDFGASTVLPTPCPPIATQSSHGPSYKPSSIQIRGSGLNSGSWESPETGTWQPAPHAIDRRLEGQEVVGGSGRRQHPGEGATTWRQRGQEEPAGRSGSSRWDKYHDSSLEHLIGAGEGCFPFEPSISDSLATGDGDDDDDDGGDGDELDFELEFNVSAEPTPGFNEYSAESGVLDWPSPSTLSLQQQCFPNDAVVMEERRSCTLIGPSPAERRALIGRRLGSSLARSRPSVVVCGSRPTGSGVLSRCLESSRQAVRLSELRFPSMESVLRQPTLKRKIIIPVSFSSPAAYKDTLSSAIIEHLNLILHDTASRLHRKKIGGLGSRGRHVSLYRNCRLFRRSVSEGFGGRTLVQRFRKKKFVTEEMNSGIKRKLFLLLNRKENHSSYSKDDLWVISTDAGFPPANVMVVCSVFYGPSASGELEVSPLREHTSSTWAQNATVHAIHVCNASWELSCLRNIRENVEVSTLPILPLMLSLEGSQERSVKSRRTGFRPPLVLAPPAHGSWVDPAQTWPRELAERTIAERGLNGEQGDVLRRVAHMIQAGAETAGVTIVQGVFGAGKSFMLSCIVMYLIGVLRRVKHEAGTKRTPLRVLISAATNVAVDRVLLGLLDLGFEEFVRVGSIKKIAKPILPFSLHAGSGNDSDQLRELQSLLKEELSPAERVFVKRSIETHKLGRNRNLLKEVSVVGATCASCPFPSMGGLCFPFVILDECSQITEPMSLLPIARFGCERLLLVGDPRQLPPTVQGSEPEHESGLEQTLFTRLKHMGHPLVQLRTQYRCHPHISLLAASLFYQGELRDGVGVAERPSAAPWLPTLAFLDVPGQEKMDTCGSYYNKAEVDAAVKLVDALVESRVEPEEIAVITLYRAQAARVHECLMSLSGSLAAVRVCTADAFQGGEVRVCVLSIVRSPRDSSSSFSSSSFVESEQRACVALTRARGNLVVLGCATSLGRGALWGRVLKHCQERGAVLSSREFSAQLDHIIAARGCGEPEGSRGSEQPQKKRRKQNPSKSPQASRKQPQPGDVDMLGSDWESGDEKLAPENDLNKSQGRPQRRRILDLGSESSDEE